MLAVLFPAQLFRYGLLLKILYLNHRMVERNYLRLMVDLFRGKSLAKKGLYDHRSRPGEKSAPIQGATYKVIPT